VFRITRWTNFQIQESGRIAGDRVTVPGVRVARGSGVVREPLTGRVTANVWRANAADR